MKIREKNPTWVFKPEPAVRMNRQGARDAQGQDPSRIPSGIRKPTDKTNRALLLSPFNGIAK